MKRRVNKIKEFLKTLVAAVAITYAMLYALGSIGGFAGDQVHRSVSSIVNPTGSVK